jgi:hypothetical protein
VHTSASIRNHNPYDKYEMIPIDKAGFPSIVKFNSLNPPRSIAWTRREIWLLAIFIILSPLIILIPLTMIFIVLPISSTRKYLRGAEREPNHSWVLENVEEEGDNDVPDNRDKREMRRWIVKQLNSALDLKRVDAYLRFTNAHAQLVNRNNNDMSAFKDVVAYCVHEVFLSA